MESIDRSICGSICGSLAAISFILSEKGLNKTEIRKYFVNFKQAFKEEFHTLMCADLLEPYLGNKPYPPDPERLEICTKAVERVVIIAQEIINRI